MQAIDMGCKREKTVVFLEDFTLNSNHIKLGCELVSFDEASLMSLSIAYRKHSPYTYYFNVFLQKMQSYGLLQILRRRNDRVNYNLEDNYEPTTVYSVLPIFALLVIGMLLSLLILIWEIFRYRMILRNHEFAKSRTNYWKPLIRPNH
ncbi:uncharacterized protein LOC107982146 [Nasonia vitripennis]|uniref:Uncharacterized protein n=1 Tax=Nasonia vitripennis TaxID=7425 RepID=A0A7M7IV34_NASVI|nr:uncharacterized protein LOC107982146 [Nasonia vitripennis]